MGAEPQESDNFLMAHQFIADKQAIVKQAQEAMESARQRMALQESGKCRLCYLLLEIRYLYKLSTLELIHCPVRSCFHFRWDHLL